MNDSENIAPVDVQTPRAPTKPAAATKPGRVGLSLSNANTPNVKRTVSNNGSSGAPPARTKRRALGDITNRGSGLSQGGGLGGLGGGSKGSLLTMQTKPTMKPQKTSMVTRRKPPLPRAIPRHPDGSALTPEQTPVPIPRDAVFEPPALDLGLDPVLPDHGIDMLKRRSHFDSTFFSPGSPPREHMSPFRLDLDDRIIDAGAMDIPLRLDDLLGPEDDLLL